MKGMEFKLVLGVFMVVVLAAILLSFAFNAKEALANIDKAAPWLHLGDTTGGDGTTPGATTTTTIPSSYFQDTPVWKTGLTISSTLKWAATDVAQEAGCKSAIESLFNPASGSFKTFVDACKLGGVDFKSGPFDLGSCKIEANSLMSYIFSDSACRAQVGMFGLDQRAWLLPSKKCGEVHRDPFDKIRYNCGLDNVCTGKIWLYYDKAEKGIGICDENIDIPKIKDVDTAKNVIIGWVKRMVSDSENTVMCRSFDSDCTTVINVPAPGLSAVDLANTLRENVKIDMGVSGAFNDGVKKLEYGSGTSECGSCWNPLNWPCCLGVGGYVRDGVGVTFSFDDPAPMDYRGVAVPCASPKPEYVAYNCGSDNVCKGDIRITYGCGGGTTCDKTNANRYLAICEKP